MPLVAGVDVVDPADAELRDAEVGGVVAGPEDDRLDAVGGVGDRGQVLGAARALDLHLEPDALGHPELGLELREQVVDERDLVGPLTLGTMMQSSESCAPATT